MTELKNLIEQHRLGCPATWAHIRVIQSPMSNMYFCCRCAQLSLLEELRKLTSDDLCAILMRKEEVNENHSQPTPL